MNLTGKAKEDFDKWYIPYIREQRPDYIQFTDRQVLGKFNRMIDSMQYGVYVDWFDSVGIDIDEIYEAEKMHSDYMYQDNENRRPETRIFTVQKANEIYNNQNK